MGADRPAEGAGQVPWRPAPRRSRAHRQGLGIEIPPVDPVPNPPGGPLEDNDDQDNALGGLLELIDALWPAAQNPHGFRTDQIAERMIDHGLGLDAQALGLRSLFDALGPCPLNAATPPWHRQPAAPGDQQSCGRRRCRFGPAQAPQSRRQPPSRQLPDRAGAAAMTRPTHGDFGDFPARLALEDAANSRPPGLNDAS